MTHIEPDVPGNGRPPGATSWTRSITEAGTTMQSYYGRPIVKEPVWQPEIPFYFFTGGLGGAASVVSLAATIAGEQKLARAARYWAAAADNVSPVLLVSDLGQPERFLNMLRVFKVTSPMSVGSWVLLVSGGASTTAAVLELTGRWKPLKVAAEVVSAAFGPTLATYTGTLVANTAIPVWSEARRELPFLFGASAAASAGAACTLVLPAHEARPARRLALGAVLVENALMAAMERRLGVVGEPYKEGAAGGLARAAKVLTLGGGLLLARGRRSRAAAVAGSALVLGGEVALRWSVFKAGFQSARDPRYTVVPQKRRAAQQQV